jgi:hypothetical protein
MLDNTAKQTKNGASLFQNESVDVLGSTTGYCLKL